jgi:hypothetical protein
LLRAGVCQASELFLRFPGIDNGQGRDNRGLAYYQRDCAFDKQPGSAGVSPACCLKNWTAGRHRSRQKTRQLIGLFVKGMILIQTIAAFDFSRSIVGVSLDNFKHRRRRFQVRREICKSCKRRYFAHSRHCSQSQANLLLAAGALLYMKSRLT